MKKEGNEANPEDWTSSDEEEEGEGERERKSKKRAMKMVMSRTREKKRAEKFYGPIVTIAEGRSRRALNKVDYNFHAYNEQLQVRKGEMRKKENSTKLKNENNCPFDDE